ncbi:MAG: hypothetical protein K2X66_06270 [Cyanobacteria bacterium]|nr:hypothetical protein [Cyanobacteriota bacterium]
MFLQNNKHIHSLKPVDRPLEHKKKALKNPSPGISIVDILLSMTIFAVAVSGMLLTTQGMFQGAREAMSRDIEAAYANMLISQVNPNNPAIETAYDVTTKTSQALPNGDQFWYTRIVNSTNATSDIKNINVYLFRSQTATTPYRIFKREISPSFFGFNLGEPSSYMKDKIGRVWAPLSANSGDASYAAFTNTAGSRKNGITEITSNVGSACGLTGNSTIFNTLHESNNVSNRLGYQFFGSLDGSNNPARNYTLRLGFIEVDPAVTANQRKMNVVINGITVDTVDPVTDAGGSCSAFNKTYSVSPTNSGGVGSIKVELTKGSGATLNPRLATIAIERSEL